ncbi:MAG: SDR family oxidoreductase [Aggregatilineales bacterium]
MLNPGLEGKVVIVTGANNPQGIGAAIAKAFASQGAKVFITYMRLPIPDDIDTTNMDEPGMAMYSHGRAQDAHTVVKDIRDIGEIAEMWEADLSEISVIAALFDRVEAVFGQVDVVVNNAAHWEPSTFVPRDAEVQNQLQWLPNGIEQLDAGLHDRAFAVNARATALMMAEFANRHVKSGKDWGRIINISTDAAHCFPTEVNYGASKLALEGYSRSAASELGQFGITVNIVSPGPIQTGYITREMEQGIAQGTPLRRVGYPEDIADVVVFLASEQARWVTGQLIHVGGGHRM